MSNVLQLSHHQSTLKVLPGGGPFDRLCAPSSKSHKTFKMADDERSAVETFMAGMSVETKRKSKSVMRCKSGKTPSTN